MARRYRKAQAQARDVHKHPLSSWRQYLPVTAILLLTTAIYSQVRTFQFMPLDDNVYVFANGHIRQGLSPQGILWALTARAASNWHPLTWISHMLDCSLFGLNPGMHHITNLLLHLASTVLLFVVLKRMTGAIWRSTLVAGLFALHPLHVESVAWVAERKDVLSAFFWMLTLLAYVRHSEKPVLKRYLLVALAFALGLMAKPMLVSLPFVLLLLDYWPLKRVDVGWKKLAVEKTPLLALALGSCVMTIIAQHGSSAVQGLNVYPIGVRAANAAFAAADYLVKMFWPINIGPMYQHPGTSLPVWLVLSSALALAALTAAAVILRKRLPYLLVGWLIYLITLIPVVGLVQVGQQGMADRYTYIPLLGVFIAIAWAVPDGLSLLFPRRLSIAPAVAGTVLLLALAVLSYHQIGAWTDRDSFISQMLVATRNHPLCRALEANLLNQAGEPEEALRKMEELARDCPRLPEAHMGLGCTLGALRQYDRAIVELNEAIRLRPEYAEAYCHLGEVCESAGRYEEALQYARKAVDMAPDVAQYHTTLAHVLATLNRPEEAISEYEAALAIQPDVPNADRPLGVLLFNMGDLTGSIEHLQIATSSNPDDPMNHYDLGIALRHTGDNSRAIEHLTEAIRLRPTWADAHGQLAMALDAAGERQRAIEELELARRYGAKVVTPSGN